MPICFAFAVSPCFLFLSILTPLSPSVWSNLSHAREDALLNIDCMLHVVPFPPLSFSFSHFRSLALKVRPDPLLVIRYPSAPLIIIEPVREEHATLEIEHIVTQAGSRD